MHHIYGSYGVFIDSSRYDLRCNVSIIPLVHYVVETL